MLNPEHSLIPYETSPLPAGPWLVFAPHGDDETYGMGGTLLKAKQQSIQTNLIILTDGALGGDKDNLVELRQGEVTNACELLGISKSQNWQEPDRGLELTSALVAKAYDAIKQTKAEAVFFPGPMELHPDHRITAAIVWAALQKIQAEQGAAPGAYSYEIGVQNPINVLVDISAQVPAKEEVMAVYASQNVENNYEELVLALDKGRTYTLPAAVSHAEGFYKYSGAQLGMPLKQVTQQIIELYF
jgi:LmbE family N-acetylglucosaminyl deacetylase